MSKKVIVDIYHTYGKGSGDELSERLAINNTVEEREGIFEHFGYDEAVDNKEDFVNGKRDVFVFYNYGGDWDEPTGGYIIIKTSDELINDIRENAQNNKTSLKGIEWGSPKFYEIIAQTASVHDFTVDKRRIDNLIDKLETDEGWKHLKRSVEDYFGY